MKSIFKILSKPKKKGTNASTPLKKSYGEEDNRQFMDNPMSFGDGDITKSRTNSAQAAELLRGRKAPEPDTLFNEPPSMMIGKLVADAPDESSVGRIRAASKAWSDSDDESSTDKDVSESSNDDKNKKSKLDISSLLPNSGSWSERNSQGGNGGGLLSKFRRNKSLSAANVDGSVNNSEEVEAEKGIIHQQKSSTGAEEEANNSNHNLLASKKQSTAAIQKALKRKQMMQRRSEGSNRRQTGTFIDMKELAKKASSDRNSLEIPSDKPLLDDQGDIVLEKEEMKTSDDVANISNGQDKQVVDDEEDDDMDVGDPYSMEPYEDDGDEDWEEYDEESGKNLEEEFARQRSRTRSVYSSDDTESLETSSGSDSDSNSNTGRRRSESGSSSSGNGRGGYVTATGVVGAHQQRVDMMRSMGYGHKPERLVSDRLNPGEKTALEEGLKQETLRSSSLRRSHSEVNLKSDLNDLPHIKAFVSKNTSSTTSSSCKLVTSTMKHIIETKQPMLNNDDHKFMKTRTNLNYIAPIIAIGVGGKLEHSDGDDSDEEEEMNTSTRLRRSSSSGRWSQSSRARSISGSTGGSSGGGGLGGSNHGAYSYRSRRSSKYVPSHVAKMQRAKVILVGDKGVGISTLVNGIYQSNSFLDHHKVQGYSSKYNGSSHQLGFSGSYQHHQHHFNSINHKLQQDLIGSEEPLGLFHSTHPVTLYGSNHAAFPFKVQLWDMGRVLHPIFKPINLNHDGGGHDEMDDEEEYDDIDDDDDDEQFKLLKRALERKSLIEEFKTDEHNEEDDGATLERPSQTSQVRKSLSNQISIDESPPKMMSMEKDKQKKKDGDTSQDNSVTSLESGDEVLFKVRSPTGSSESFGDEIDLDIEDQNGQESEGGRKGVRNDEEDDKRSETNKKTPKNKIKPASKRPSATEAGSSPLGRSLDSPSSLLPPSPTSSSEIPGQTSDDLVMKSSSSSPISRSSSSTPPIDGSRNTSPSLQHIIQKKNDFQHKRKKSLMVYDEESNEDTRVSVLDSHLRGASVIGVCYDISDASTLDSLNLWLRRIGDAGVDFSKVPIMLICNKIDLTDPPVVSTSSDSASNEATPPQSSPDVSASESESEANFGEEVKSLAYHNAKFGDSTSTGLGRDSEAGGVAVGCSGKKDEFDSHGKPTRRRSSLRDSFTSSVFRRPSLLSSSSHDNDPNAMKAAKKLSAKKRRELERQELAAAALRRRKRLEAFPQVRLARDIGEKHGLLGFSNGHGRVELVSAATGEGLEDALFRAAELVQRKRQSGKGFGSSLASLSSSISNNALSSMHGNPNASPSNGGGGGGGAGGGGSIALGPQSLGQNEKKPRPKLKTITKLIMWGNSTKPKI